MQRSVLQCLRRRSRSSVHLLRMNIYKEINFPLQQAQQPVPSALEILCAICSFLFEKFPEVRWHLEVLGHYWPKRSKTIFSERKIEGISYGKFTARFSCVHR